METVSINIEYLPFTHDELPASKTFDLDGVNYEVIVRYNDLFDFYTCEIYDNEGAILFTGKLSYLRDIIDTVFAGSPVRRLVPLIIADALREVPEVERISSTNFDSVKVCLI